MPKKSKTSRINECRDRLISTFCCYALLAHDWEPKKEQDFDNFAETLNEILEEFLDG